MYESGHGGAGREELRRALVLLEAALARYGQPGPCDGRGDAAHRALSQALLMMRQEADALRIALAR